MKKIDRNLKRSYILSRKDTAIDCLVYCKDMKKAEDFLRSKNIEIIKKFAFLEAIAVCVQESMAEELSRQEFVRFLSSQAKAFTLVNVSKKILGSENLQAEGEGVGVAIIDTGIKPHLDFVFPKNRIKKFVDLIEGKDFPYDDNGHGTFVAGVLLGNGILSNRKYAGFAPKSDIISIKALSEKGEGNAVQILDAMQWVFDNHRKYNIKVVCMSFGSEPLGASDPIMRGAERLWQRGIVVVAAAGNSGPKFQTIKSPGTSAKIITVGGFNDNRNGDWYNKNSFQIADFSSRGPALGRIKPDCIAPCVEITSCGIKDFYTTLSGTSVATPMIAGLCAQILSENRNLTPDQVKKIILKNCKSIISFGGYSKRNIEGYGYPFFE